MPGLYSRWMTRWENRLASQDTNRKVRPFEWGLEWLSAIAPQGWRPQANGNCVATLDSFVAAALRDSPAFYSYRRPSDYRLEGTHLTFSSASPCPHPENNVVHADFFPASRDRAVLVLPQWNADAGGHAGLCRLLNRFGLTALRMSLAYHDRRMPAHLERADYHVSSNIGRTIHAARQSVLDARSCLDWLQDRGYSRLGILGTSLGSCIAFITTAHDNRIATGVYNHVSMRFGDVVWTGLSTRHVREGFGEAVSHGDLCRYWSVISPASFFGLMERRPARSLLVWARHDTTFLPVYSRQVLAAFQEHGLEHEVFTLPCGHYTTGRFPFNLMDGLGMCRYLARNL